MAMRASLCRSMSRLAEAGKGNDSAVPGLWTIMREVGGGSGRAKGGHGKGGWPPLAAAARTALDEYSRVTLYIQQVLQRPYKVFPSM